MGTISISLPADGTAADVSDYNSPITTIVNEMNGNLNAANLAANSVTTAKIANSSVTASKIDWASTGPNGGIWWEELGRTTLAVNGDTMAIATIAARKYLQVLIHANATGGTIAFNLNFNGDTAANYAYRNSSNGGADGTASSATFGYAGAPAATGVMQSQVFITNILSLEKIAQFVASNNNGSGAANAPNRLEGNLKWANTTAQITSLTVTNNGTGDFAAGAEVLVLGHN